MKKNNIDIYANTIVQVVFLFWKKVGGVWLGTCRHDKRVLVIIYFNKLCLNMLKLNSSSDVHVVKVTNEWNYTTPTMRYLKWFI